MARAVTKTLLSLEQWAEVMGYNPWEFNQIGTGIQFARDTQCPTVFYQYQWQKQFLSREEIALAIAQAELALEKVLGFPIAPKWIESEEVLYPNKAAVSSGLTNGYHRANGTWKSVALANGYIQQLGQKVWTLLEAGVTYTRSDPDGDSFNELFTATVTAADLDITKIKVFYAAADRDNLDETWEIRPLKLSYDGTTLTIKGKMYQLVQPPLTEVIKPSSLDATDTIYVETVDVYIETADTDFGAAIWDKGSGLYCDTSSASFDITDAQITQPRRIRPVINPAYSYGRLPNRLSINYQAGYPLEGGKVSQVLALMIARLSTNYLPALSCGCDRPDQILFFWRSFPSDTEQGARPMTQEEINENPFGTSRGAIFAWQNAQLLLQTIGLGV